MAAGFQRVGCSTEKKKPIWHIVVAEIEKKNTVLLLFPLAAKAFQSDLRLCAVFLHNVGKGGFDRNEAGAIVVISASTTLSVEKKIASFPAKALLGVQRFCGGQKQKITAQVRELVKVAT